MITNPLFAPQNARLQYGPSMPASLAYALMPTDNFAQKRADAAMAMQYQTMLSGMAEQAVAEKEKALRETNESLGLIAQQNILPSDMRRLNDQYTSRWRQQMEHEIEHTYGGDIVRFRRERQPYYASRMQQELTSSPQFQQALANKTNYALAQEALSKGKLIEGNWDQDWADFQTGKTPILRFRGAYEPPKDTFDYFDKTAHPTSPEGVNGRPIEVSQDDLLAHLTGNGLSASQAADYIGKLGYQGGRYWKREQQKSWDAQQQAFERKMQTARLGLARSEYAEAVRHHLKTEANEKAKAAAMNGGVPTVVTEVYTKEGSRPAYKTRDGMVITAKAGATGRVGEALLRAAGINPNQNAGSVYASSAPKLPDGKENPDYNRKLYNSSAYEVLSPDFTKKYTNGFGASKSPQPFLFDSVDPSVIYYYGDKPYLQGTARINGNARKVMVPIPDNELVRGELTNQAGIYNSKDELRQFQTNQQQAQRRSSLSTDTKNFLDD